VPYLFHYGNGGVHKFDNGSNQTNPTVPPEAIAVAVHPHVDPSRWTPAASLDHETRRPAGQWITADTNPASPHYARVYAMRPLFVFNPSVP
jgi:hypothetical protein